MVFPYYKQETDYSCGAAAMRMVLGSLEIRKTEKELARLLNTAPKHGTWFRDFITVSRKFNLDYISQADGDITQLKTLMKQGYSIIVCYLLLKEKCDHYSVIKKVDKNTIHFFDPWFGKNHKYSIGYFNTIWKSRKRPDRADRWFIAIKKI